MTADVDPHVKASKRTPWGTILIVVTILVVIAFFLIPAWVGYRPRGMVADAIKDGAPLRVRIDEFYQQRRELPVGAEAAAFRLDRELTEAQSVVWNPRERTIVITMGGSLHHGKRFAYTAQPGGDRLEWKCSTIDLDTKYLPANCR